MGEFQDALRLLLPLRAAARNAGAAYDESVYAYGIAQVHYDQGQWAEALTSYADTATVFERLGDRTGLAYAHAEMAACLMRLGRPHEALTAARRALDVLDRQADPRQFELATLTWAEVLAALGRHAEANATLEAIEAEVRQRDLSEHRILWLNVRADVMQKLGRWREASLALVKAHTLSERCHEQRLSLQSARALADERRGPCGP